MRKHICGVESTKKRKLSWDLFSKMKQFGSIWDLWVSRILIQVSFSILKPLFANVCFKLMVVQGEVTVAVFPWENDRVLTCIYFSNGLLQPATTSRFILRCLQDPFLLEFFSSQSLRTSPVKWFLGCMTSRSRIRVVVLKHLGGDNFANTDVSGISQIVNSLLMDVLNEPFHFKTSKLKRQYAFLWRDQLVIQRHGWRHLGFRRRGAAFVCVPHLRARYCQCTLGRGWQRSNPWKMWGWYDESRQSLVGIGHLGWLSHIFWLVGRFLLIF